MGSSVDEGDDLLNVKTGRATALSTTSPVLFLPQDSESDRASAASTAEMSAMMMLALL